MTLIEYINNQDLNSFKDLVQRTSDINIFNTKGWNYSPLELACTKSYGLEYVKILVNKGVDLKHPNNIQCLLLACNNKRRAIIMYILDYNVDVTIMDIKI